MQTNATLQMVAIAKRIAVQNGVSVSEVIDRFSRGVKKSAHTKSDFFWGCGDISPMTEKKFIDARRSVLPTCGVRAMAICRGVKK